MKQFLRRKETRSSVEATVATVKLLGFLELGMIQRGGRKKIAHAARNKLKLVAS